MNLDAPDIPEADPASDGVSRPGDPAADASESPTGRRRSRATRILTWLLLLLVVIAAGAFLFARIYFGRAMRANLPQLDGAQIAYGLGAPVTVTRDAHGVPHIRAASMDDLIFAQGYVTAQDRLWQMELLRRHAAGELAAVIGKSMLPHDEVQRALQLRAAADRAVVALPPEQQHWLMAYARGVNASIIAQRDHLPIEFRLLGYKPAPWTPRDSLLVELAMFQDLTNQFPGKLGREALSAHLPPELVADLYPVGSWRDHPPGAPIPDVTAQQPEIKDVPLDESQSKMQGPAGVPPAQYPAQHPAQYLAPDLAPLQRTLALFDRPCATCVAGSNSWAVAGSRTASGKPMLSNDMHLALQVPGVWYEADLEAPLPAPLAAFHATGVTLPGAPFIVAGHNAHVAWGFTNLGADVQDLYIEHTRGTPSGAQYETATGEWLPMKYHAETIHVRGSSDVVLNVPLTRHGNMDTPVISVLVPGETRTLSLRWTIYDQGSVSLPFFGVDIAADGNSMLGAFSSWGGPPENLVYADDQGHIGYHAVGHVPVRGDANSPAALSPVPTDAAAPDAASHEWAGYIPFDQLPQALDPADGILATANSRVTPDGYRYPIALDWMAPYRTERIYKVLEASAQRASDANEPGTVAVAVPRADAKAGQDTAPGHLLTPADMLTLQTDVYSELDRVIAQRLAYAIDHATGPLKDDKSLHQAADILRKWNGNVDATAAAPAIVNAARETLWPMLLIPKLAPQAAAQLAQGADMAKLKLPSEVAAVGNLWQGYTWAERGCVEEKLLTDTPARWLPASYANWNDFLAAVVKRGLTSAGAPADLGTWQQGNAAPLDIEHPIFARFAMARELLGVPTGTGPQAHSGDGTTVKQMGRAFGPSDRFTADLGDPDRTTLNIVLGESGNPASQWFMDQFPDWLAGRTYSLPFTDAATQPAIAHTLTLNPR
jgi:penicillin amidase